jgi:hypothetical protein
MGSFSKTRTANGVEPCTASPCTAKKNTADNLAVTAAHAIDNQVNSHTDPAAYKKTQEEGQTCVLSSDL